MKNENTPAVASPATTSTPLRVKTNVRAGAWYHIFASRGNQGGYDSGRTHVGGVRG
jgi:hypothetical protein